MVASQDNVMNAGMGPVLQQAAAGRPHPSADHNATQQDDQLVKMDEDYCRQAATTSLGSPSASCYAIQA